MLKRLAALVMVFSLAASAAENRELKIMVIFAHPDEGEIYAGGTAALYAKLGHRVKFLSLTNGDHGHFSMKAEDLAKRRFKEAMQAKSILNIAEYEVLDYHDNKLQNTPEVREKVAAKILEYQPDLVFSYYPAIGGHIDNMAAGWIVRAASAALPREKMPVFLHMRDFFTSRLTYVPHIAVDIGSVWETKLAALGAHESQVFEANPKRQGILEEVQASREKQREVLFINAYSFSHVTPDNLLTLEKWYGRIAAEKVTYVEAFEVAEYGRQVREQELRELMPMTGRFVTLPGRTAWLDTGIDVIRGKPIEISAAGRIQWNSNGRLTCPPTGAVPYTRFGNKPMPGVNTGAIIGKVGQGSTDYFYVGGGDQILPFSTGRLFVGINDDNVSDNAGYYRVWLTQSNE